jgi:hypothetical protein
MILGWNNVHWIPQTCVTIGTQTRDGRGEGDAMGEAQYVIDQGT